MSLVPIVLFVYNRPTHTKQTLDALRKNEFAKDSDLFIFSDAPKNDNAKEEVEQVRELLKTIDGFKSVTVVEREKNWGLADSIVDGVTKIIDQYGKVIVLEDDIVTSPAFLKFMNDALNLYENEEKVMHVSAYFPPIKDDLPATFFYQQTSCWGWGTWDRAWKSFSTDTTSLLEKIKNNKKGEYFNIVASQLQANLDGRIKTWAAKWQAAVYIKDGLCLHPRVSFVSNIGHDGTGVHSMETGTFKTDVLNTGIDLKKIPIIGSIAVEEVMEVFYKKMKPSLLKKTMNYLRQYKKMIK